MSKSNYNILHQNIPFARLLPRIMGEINQAYGSEKLRIIKNLKKNHKLTTKEIAVVFGTTPRAVSKIIQRYEDREGELASASLSSLSSTPEILPSGVGQTSEEAAKEVDVQSDGAVGSIPTPQLIPTFVGKEKKPDKVLTT